MTTVSLARCRDYADVSDALEQCLAELGGMGAYVSAGQRVLLKVNLVSTCAAARAGTTHPALVAAVIEAVRHAGGRPAVGDSPPAGSVASVAGRAGLSSLCARHGVPLVDLDEPRVVMHPAGRLVKAFRVSGRLADFDVIINLPKLKTHVLVGMTCAVKNLFGCVPGKLKTAHHLMQQDVDAFSEMLLDLHDVIAPGLNVVDAVVGMEGPGPGKGNPRTFGWLVAGPSAVAVDAVCARLLGFAESEVPTVRLALQRGVAGATLDDIRVRGLRLDELAISDLARPRRSFTRWIPRFIMHWGKAALTLRPKLATAHCTGCGECVAHCAPQAIRLAGHRVHFDTRRCIRCHGCAALCPTRAITLTPSPLARLLGPTVKTP
jgi:uncharacterized protein (DUF362 family)/Pyruvate/2-oxoacid:ferredoxin oxidoreductase delta subunit